MRSTIRQSETGNTILFLQNSLIRTTRLFLSGLMSVAAKRGWHIQHATPLHTANAAYISKLISLWQPLGIVAVYTPGNGIPLPNPDVAIPFVCIDLDPSVLSRRHLPLPPRMGFIHCDSKILSEIAAKTFLEHDFVSFAYVSANMRYHWSEQRKRYFREAIELNGRTCHCFDGTGLAASGTTTSKRLGHWLTALPKPCGLLAANDHTAAQVLSIAEREGIKVPDELSVLGIDDDEELCESATPPLSSIRCDFFGGGVQAGKMIGTLLENRTYGGLDNGYGAVRQTIRQSTRRQHRFSPSIRLATETIRLRATEGITAADIIPVIGGSRRSAERKFRDATGHGILEEILNVRFEKVKELLATSAQLKSIAQLSGFSSSNSLQRIFKAHFGTTLTDYRKNIHGKFKA